MDGPFTTAVDANAGPGRAGLVVRPSMLGADGLQHPIFIWGPGRGTRVRDYESLMRRIASHGFVVYSEISQAADGTEMIAAIDWLIAENKRSGSPYFQKLDEMKIGVGGHSFGSNSAMTASSDPRVKAFVHTAGSGFRGAGKALNLQQPAAFICGEDDPTANVTDCRTDYMQTSSPVFFTIIAGEDHLSTPMAGLPLVVAWLRWHLGDESDRNKMFIGPDCDYCTGVYTSLSKNF
jgi:dienelactone hydrolase